MISEINPKRPNAMHMIPNISLPLKSSYRATIPKLMEDKSNMNPEVQTSLGFINLTIIQAPKLHIIKLTTRVKTNPSSMSSICPMLS